MIGIPDSTIRTRWPGRLAGTVAGEIRSKATVSPPTAAGWSSDYAWMAALVAYVLTVRVVRGRWPLQPAR